MYEFCLVCAAKGHLVEAIHPRKCVINGGAVGVCPRCNEVSAMVSEEVAEETILAFARASGIESLMVRKSGWLKSKTSK